MTASTRREDDFGPAMDLSSYAPAYGKEIGDILQRISAYVQRMTAGFAIHFYDALTRRSESAAILDHLSAEERTQLQIKQTQHLNRLMSPTLMAADHCEHAQRVGRIHEMVGVGLPALLEAYHLYQRKIHCMLADSGLTLIEQQRLGQALQLRLMLDMEAQVSSHYQTEQSTAAFLSAFEKAVRDVGNLPDLLQSVMQQIAGVEGVFAGLFLRPDTHGTLRIEAAGCSAGVQYAQSMQNLSIPLIEIRSDTPAGQGPAGFAWRNGNIEVAEFDDFDEHLSPWQEVGLELGFRSNAAVPLQDDSGHPFALLLLYSQWPGFFNAPARQTILRHIQQVLSRAVLSCEQGLVTPAQQRREYRQRLEQGAMRLRYQPIIDLRTGHIQHVEALARLYGADGTAISPAAFLPAFGKSDQLHLFQQGLTQVCRDSRRWRDSGLHVSVSLNLPAEGLSDDAYLDSLLAILQAGETEASQLRLEVLESHEPLDLAKRDSRLAELRRAGFSIVQDDLGSGHSSLLRMDRIAFDEVKIDQGLVRNTLGTPQRALEFIYHLTRLAHGFGVPVTVEGLESQGLLEAAAILGADHGQGYGIARPMPAAEFPAWHERFVYSIDPRHPRTPLGALAGFLLWDQQLAALTRWPDLIEDFVRSSCLVQRYITDQGLEDTPLQALLHSNHACALRGQSSAMYTHTKNELIRTLGQDWLRQRDSSDFS
jgi:EAL domain-containing protein (putative c-di-GMP-specific phosphodiesterase class I)